MKKKVQNAALGNRMEAWGLARGSEIVSQGV